MTRWPGADALGRDPPSRGVLAQRRDEVRALEHPLALHPQDVDDVGVGDRRDVVRGGARPGRQERGGPTRIASAPTSRERLYERARDARVQDVADDRDMQPVQAAERLAHRVEVEQRLRRMLVLAVAGVHDARVG